MLISERIYKYMEEKGISQLEFAKRTGISQSTVSDWKRKKTNPSADKIMIICEVLGISPYELLQGTDNQKLKEYKQHERLYAQGSRGFVKTNNIQMMTLLHQSANASSGKGMVPHA